MSIQKNLRLIDFYTICTSFMFVIPVIVPYYRDEIGLTFREFLIGEIFFAATLVLLDLPMSLVSDVWRRKHVLALGACFEMLGWVVLIMAKTFFMAVLAQVIIGIGISLFIGTLSAMLYDTLLSEGRQGEYRWREGRRQGLGLYTLTFSGLVGGFLYTQHHMLPLLLTLPALMLAIMIACMMDEPSRHKKAVEKHPLHDVIETTKYALHGHPDIGMMIIFAGILFSTTKLIMWSQQPYYMALQIPEVYFGMLTATGSLLGGLSSHFSHKVDGKVSGQQALWIALLLVIVVSLGSSLHLGWMGVALLMVGGTCIFGAVSPRVNEEINHRVGSERRATILSTQNLLRSLLFMPLSFILGGVSKEAGIQGMLQGLTIWLCIAGTGLWLLQRLYRRKR